MPREPKSLGDYEVGYGRPPTATRFQPGQSGNPKGRAKAARNVKTLAEEALRPRPSRPCFSASASSEDHPHCVKRRNEPSILRTLENRIRARPRIVLSPCHILVDGACLPRARGRRRALRHGRKTKASVWKRRPRPQVGRWQRWRRGGTLAACCAAFWTLKAWTPFYVLMFLP